MVKIYATEERTLRVRAPVSEVHAFFLDPQRVREVSADVESFERLDEHRARWVLTEKVEKGVRFHADYTVEYQSEHEGHVAWRSTSGNMDVDGEVKLSSVGPQCTEICYRETVGPDLPITKLTAILFKPIVARELRQDIVRFLDRVIARLGGAPD
ncbi:MAG: hypothetical protein KDK70_22115 [Myxococcales bacterium]|nr:hypothetical protein [Myxococcales bacterium]